ncbi:MAG: GNAT family N-acetyltransferase [Pseudomonadota bacterium]|nr:GNAT family N-acetyltransferase [Pseudomonadota bacterium]
MTITIRSIANTDIEACGRIVYETFKRFHDRHQFPRDFQTLEDAVQLTGLFVDRPAIFGVVAEIDGRIVGSNFLDERNLIRGIGPITVAPDVQERGVGRQLMEAVIEREREPAGIRLVQDAFNMCSLSLYASLEFEVKEPLALVQGKPKGKAPAGVEVRLLRSEDLGECASLCIRVHGFDRVNELRDACELFSPVVALREGRITAYASAPFYWKLNHGVAETEEDMRALIMGAGTVIKEPLAMLVPVRQASFFRWCLREGLRVLKPMTLMAIGMYQEPNGCYFPSVLY